MGLPRFLLVVGAVDEATDSEVIVLSDASCRSAYMDYITKEPTRTWQTDDCIFADKLFCIHTLYDRTWKALILALSGTKNVCLLLFKKKNAQYFPSFCTGPMWHELRYAGQSANIIYLSLENIEHNFLKLILTGSLHSN